jgi:hypothetical protein
MSQWGSVRSFKDDAGGTIRVLAHVKTDVWEKAEPHHIVDKLLLIDGGAAAATVLANLNNRYVGRPYQEWQRK